MISSFRDRDISQSVNDRQLQFDNDEEKDPGGHGRFPAHRIVAVMGIASSSFQMLVVFLPTFVITSTAICSPVAASSVVGYNEGLTSGASLAARSRRSGTFRRRSLIMFGTMDSWIHQQKELRYRDKKRILLASSTESPVPQTEYKAPPLDDDSEYQDEQESAHTEGSTPRRDPSSKAMTEPPGMEDLPARRGRQRTKMWPPWPFNLLQRSQYSRISDMEHEPRRQGPAIRMGSFLFSFFGQRARVSFKELQNVGSRLWFHLPPMTPPLILLTLLPRQEEHIVTSVETGLEAVVQRTVIPLWSNPLARGLVLTGFSFAIMSWAHSEMNRLRKLTPLPLNDAYRQIHSAVLPHVLPEEVPEPFVVEEDEDNEEQRVTEQETATTPVGASIESDNRPDAEKEASLEGSKAAKQSLPSISQKLAASVPPRLQRHFKQFGGAQQDDLEASNNLSDQNPKRRLFGSRWRKNMKRMRDVRRAEAQKVRRMAVYDELVALQAIKRKAKQGAKDAKKHVKTKVEGDVGREEPLGYALVTGASRGIGRAIAGKHVEPSTRLTINVASQLDQSNLRGGRSPSSWWHVIFLGLHH